ncbi:hypothetical protein HDU76_002571 [Blyttiomyces sp. JEL0837]|nr:hypothetical protein HDU76_002571 [Blyttiomyces sp. JEL0837]
MKVSAGVDNHILKLLADDNVNYLNNGDVHAVVGQPVIIKVSFSDQQSQPSTISGFLTDVRIQPSSSHSGSHEFGYRFVGQQAKVLPNETELEGVWSGVLEFSKFRWAVNELEKSTIEEFQTAESKSVELSKADPKRTEEVYETAQQLFKESKYERVIDLLTLALSSEILDDEKPEDDEEFDPEAGGTPSTFRLLMLSLRSESSFQLRCFKSAIRDVELIERIYGLPMDVIEVLKESEASAYFQSILRRAKAYRALGDFQQASHNCLNVMVLDVLLDPATIEANEENGTSSNFPLHVAEETVTEAREILEGLNFDPNTITIYTLHIELQGTDPLVWRTFDVPGDTTLADLVSFVNAVMGWCG